MSETTSFWGAACASQRHADVYVRENESVLVLASCEVLSQPHNP